MRNRARSGAGFSLIEMMVVMAIMGVVTAQLFVVFANQKRVFMSNERALDVQESSRLTLDLVSFDTRMAGFMVPRWTAVSSVDGGTTASDRFCVSSSSFVAINSPTLVNRGDRFPGSQVMSVTANTITVDNTDIDGDGAIDFQVNAGAIVATPTRSYCAVVRDVTATQVTFSSPEDAGTYTGGVTADMRAVPANVYVLDEPNLELRRNGLLLASQIEDFQIEYWVDSSGPAPDGIENDDDEFPVNDLGSPDPPGGGIPANNAQVRRVRVSVIARTLRDEGGTNAGGKLTYSRPQLANRIAGTATDTFRRRSFSASILPRNLVTIGDTE